MMSYPEVSRERSRPAGLIVALDASEAKRRLIFGAFLVATPPIRERFQRESASPIPLPFGGPSHETREGERAIYDQTKEIQARIQRRVDSTLAARRQRHVDSLARVDHATRSELPD